MKVGSPITPENVGLLRAGDWLLVRSYANDMRACRLLEDPSADAGALRVDEDGQTHPNVWSLHRFTFLGRPCADGFIPWEGGDNPAGDLVVDVTFADGEDGCWMADEPEWAEFWRAGAIKGWRPHVPQPAEPTLCVPCSRGQHSCDCREQPAEPKPDPFAAEAGDGGGARSSLHDIAKDAAERVHKNGGCVPQLAFAPILWALQDAMPDHASLTSRIAELEAERRRIVSHATMGSCDGNGLSLNDVSVEITRSRNALYETARSRLKEKTALTATDLSQTIRTWLDAEDPTHWGDFEKDLDAAISRSATRLKEEGA